LWGTKRRRDAKREWRELEKGRRGEGEKLVNSETTRKTGRKKETGEGSRKKKQAVPSQLRSPDVE